MTTLITAEDIRKLAKLSRIEISDEEAQNLTGEIEPILEYVGKVRDVAGEEGGEVEIGSHYNVMREDANPIESGLYTDALLREAPEKQDGYVKVKKIL